MFPLAISADYQKGQYELIYGIPGLTQITGQDKKSTEDSQAQAVAYKGKEPKEAEKNFNKNQENYLDMGHLKVLILGKGILQEKEALEEFCSIWKKNRLWREIFTSLPVTSRKS